MDLLKAMHVFVSVAEEGSFAKASRTMNLAPAIVTRLVAQLEEHLDARLINRTTRRLAVTEVGAAYLERARAIFADIEETERLTRADASEASGLLRIAAPPALMSHQLVRHLPEFRSRYPKVTLNLHATQRADVLDEAADITLMVAPSDSLDGDFVARRLALAEVVFCATPEYLARRGRPVHPNELASHDLLVSNAVSPRNWHFEHLHTGEGVDDSVVFRGHRLEAIDTVHHETLYEAALAGMGIVRTLSFMADKALASGALQRVLPDWRLNTYSVWAASMSRKHQPARARVFIDFLLEKFGGGASDPWLAQFAVAEAHGASCEAS
jgi:DNA-binding transcriptional LysR family regulator